LDEAGRREAAGRQAAQLAGLGVTMNFGPCVDVAVAPEGPVIGALGRSYGVEADIVVDCARIVIEAHLGRGVACCIKHFPGHGSARVDSHEEVADVSGTYDEGRELGVFSRLIESALASAVMVGHVVCDRFDGAHPASLSRATIEGVLRGRLGFGGVVVTDSLDMGAIAGRHGLDEAVVMAVNAGADLIVHGFNRAGQGAEAAHPAPMMLEAIARGVVDGRIEGGMGRIEASAMRVRSLGQGLGSRSRQ
jgi:beta-N-acetylhexosaminidase